MNTNTETKSIETLFDDLQYTLIKAVIHKQEGDPDDAEVYRAAYNKQKEALIALYKEKCI